jgi:ferredoxin
LACNHCLDAPCQSHCPASAIDRDLQTGAVLIDDGKCIGCKYCGWACPYDAPRFDATDNVMTKCTWCHLRLVEGRVPACVEQCPTTALRFGELEGEAVVPGFPDTPAKPAIRFAPLRDERCAPETTWELPDEILRTFEAARPRRDSPISLASEWPLLLFTLLVSVLVGWVLAAQGTVAPPPLPLFVAAAGLAAAASTLHLGRKRRMWRAILNVRRSWLSREILSFGGFCAATLVHMLWPGVQGGRAVAAVLGIVTLFSIDRVYDPVRPPGLRAHSADTLLTGALVGFLAGHLLAAAAAIAVGKLVLYLARFPRERGESIPWGIRGLRVLGLLAVISAPLSGSGSIAIWLALALGEILDRAQFYEGLEASSPRRTAVADLALARSRAR